MGHMYKSTQWGTGCPFEYFMKDVHKRGKMSATGESGWVMSIRDFVTIL